MKKLDSSIKTYWRLQNSIENIVAILILSGVFYLRDTFEWLALIPSYVYIILGILIILNLVYDLAIFVPLSYRFWSYSFDTSKLELHHGFIVRKFVTVPLVRVQHITLAQGPLQKLFRLSSLHIHTAGNSFKIPGIKESESEEFRNTIAEYVRLAKEEK